MKKALTGLLCAALLFQPCAFASNSATEKTALPIRIYGAGPVRPYEIVIDTVDTDLTIRTPASGNMACIVGIDMSEGTAANFTFSTGTDTNLYMELAANQGLAQNLGEGIFYCTQPGEALKVKSSAAITGFWVNVVEAARFDINHSK
jgi:hypothetical protein